MSLRPYCGIDFGTSNSAVSVGRGDQVQLVPVEGDAVTLPSALFFNTEEDHLSFGRKAIAEYLDGYEGRLMRALKSVLGSHLITETTQVGTKRKNFREIIGLYIAHVKQAAERHAGERIEDVVLGRPVHFVDDDAEADQRAENELRGIAEAQGFKTIRFEYEPLAAARDYASRLSARETVLVVDIGGGTSDFSVLSLSPDHSDILANTGVHIGGTDFDRLLSMDTAMVDMGWKSKLKSGLDMPGLTYHQLSTWHLINFLYTQKVMHSVRELHHLAERRDLTQRLIKVLEDRMGHAIASRIEAAKIALSSDAITHIDYGDIEAGWVSDVTRETLITATAREVARVVATALLCVEKADLKPDAIHTLFMTGGSTAMPGFEAAMQAAFPAAKINYGDRFSSVASGLGLAARAAFTTL